MRRWHGSGISGTRTWTLTVDARPRRGWRWSTYPPGGHVRTYDYARSGMGHTWTRRGAYRAARRDIRREMRRDRRLTARDVGASNNVAIRHAAVPHEGRAAFIEKGAFSL